MSTTLSDIRESFWHAAMAKAAYAAITDDGTLRQALNDDGFSPALIDEFLDRYSVQAVASSADSYQGVIFREKNTSHYILASRGTQEITDFGVDGILALFGSTPQDGNARGLFGQIISIPDVSEITVTGHSLGGYLATMLAHEYGSQIDHLYTYNGAGYGTPILPAQASLFLTNSALSNLFGANPISFPLDSASNFITDENVEVVPTLGFHLGEITKMALPGL